MNKASLGIYLHLPFCRARCTYCAFAISTFQSREAEYHRAMLGELRSSSLAGGQVDSIYLGGGTPSLSPPEHIEALLEEIRSRFKILPDAEVTLEANPEDLTEAALARWGASGVTRISIGVQSYRDEELYPLGRGHGAAGARAAVQAAVRSGLRVSLDLIIGLPHQTVATFEASLQEALHSGVGHVSLYMLDLESGSKLEQQVHQRRVTLPEDSDTADLYLLAVDRAACAGFRHYEISNFARPGEESRHNLKYWSREPYLGFGLGAHSFFGEQRWSNARELTEYIDRIQAGDSPVVFRETLGTPERQREQIFLGLRQAQGMRYSELLALRGEEATQWVSRGLSEGWLQNVSDRVAFTGSGFLLSNEYLSQLF